MNIRMKKITVDSSYNIQLMIHTHSGFVDRFVGDIKQGVKTVLSSRRSTKGAARP